MLQARSAARARTRLKAARVLVDRRGRPWERPSIQYLAAAGVGTLGIADHDTVSLSNLQRQVLFATDDIGAPKVAKAAAAVDALNPHVRVETHAVRVDPDNAAALLEAYDLVVDGSDNFATRYAVSDACYFAGRPLVTGSIGTFDGSVTTLRPFEHGADGTPNPTYRCLFPEPPPEGSVPTCAEAGVVGALTGIIGSTIALEAIREIVGFGEGLVGRLLLIDSLSWRFQTLRYRWDPANPLNGQR